MKSIKYITVLLLFLSAIQAKAQPYVDLANIQYTRFNEAPMKNDMNASVDHSILYGGFFLPLPLKNNNRLIIGADNTNITIDYKGNDTSYTSKLQSTSVQLGLLKQWKNEKWSTLFLLIPRQAADFKNTYNSDRQLGGAVITTYAWKKDLKFKFGMYYNSEFFGNYFMPLAGLDWKVNENLNIWGLLPGSLNVNYKLGKIVTVGLDYQSVTATFRPEGSDGSNYIREGHTFFSDQQLSLKADLYVLKNLVCFVGAGMTGFHYFQEYNGIHKKVSSLPEFQQSRDRGYMYAGLAFRVKAE